MAKFHIKWKILALLMFYFVTQDEITTSNPTKICLDHASLPNKPLQKQQFSGLT